MQTNSLPGNFIRVQVGFCRICTCAREVPEDLLNVIAYRLWEDEVPGPVGLDTEEN